jgi:Flp pilus assembly pilin Flp
MVPLTYFGNCDQMPFWVRSWGRIPASRSSVGPQGVKLNLFVIKSWIEARLHRGEEGANLVEYILLIALIAMLVIAAIVVLRGAINDRFQDTSDCLNAPAGC